MQGGCVRSGPRKSCHVEGDILTRNCHRANDNDESISIAFLHNTFISVPVTLGVTFNLDRLPLLLQLRLGFALGGVQVT